MDYSSLSCLTVCEIVGALPHGTFSHSEQRSRPKLKNIPSTLASNKSRSFNQVKIDRRRHSNENRLTRVPSNHMTHPMNPGKGHLKHCWLRNDKEVRQIITPSSETNSVQFPNIVNLMNTSLKTVTCCALRYVMSLSYKE